MAAGADADLNDADGTSPHASLREVILQPCFCILSALYTPWRQRFFFFFHVLRTVFAAVPRCFAAVSFPAFIWFGSFFRQWSRVSVADVLLFFRATLWTKGTTPKPSGRFLLHCKAKVNAVDGEGKSPLHAAARSDAVGVAGILLSDKAGVNSQDRSGATPLHDAAEADSKRGW